MTLRGDQYETVEETKFRLEGTVVLYDGAPVYITAVQMPGEEDAEEIARVYFRELPLTRKPKRGDDIRKYLSSRKFDLSPFKMGYANYEGHAIYISRAPVRGNKQGLCRANVAIRGADGSRCGWFEFHEFLHSKSFVDMFNGDYPSFREAKELFAGDPDGCKSVAVSRDFAICPEADLGMFFLVHKGTKCGISLEGDQGIRLSPRYAFLNQVIEQARIPLA